MSTKFNFSKELKSELATNGKAWDELLFRACMEAKEKEVKATEFCKVLRESGFRCGTGPARAAYKAVRDGKDQKGMIAAITVVKAKRKGTDKGTETGTDKGTEKGTDTGTDTGKADTLVGVLKNAVHAAENGNFAVAESWIVKAQALIDTAKKSTAQAIEKIGGIVEKSA